MEAPAHLSDAEVLGLVGVTRGEFARMQTWNVPRGARSHLAALSDAHWASSAC